MRLLVFGINFLLLAWTVSANEDCVQEEGCTIARSNFGSKCTTRERNLDGVASGAIDNAVAVVYAEFDEMITKAAAELDRLDARRKKFEAIAPGLETFLAESNATAADENLVMEVMKYLDSVLDTLNEFQRSFELLESLTLYAHRHAVVPVRDQDVDSRLRLFEEKVKIPLVQRLEALKEWFRPPVKDVPPMLQLLEEFKLGSHELTEEESVLIGFRKRLQHSLQIQEFVQNHELNTPKVPQSCSPGSGSNLHSVF